MAHTDARRGAGQVEPPTQIAAALILKDEVRQLARHLAHASELARIAADGPEPEHGAEYLLDTLADLRPRFLALQDRIRR
jgi:hypothetical protein